MVWISSFSARHFSQYLAEILSNNNIFLDSDENVTTTTTVKPLKQLYSKTYLLTKMTMSKILMLKVKAY